MKNFKMFTLAALLCVAVTGVAGPGGWIDGKTKNRNEAFLSSGHHSQSIIPNFVQLAQDNMEIPSAYYLNSDKQAIEFVNKDGQLRSIRIDDIAQGYWNPQK